MSVHGDEEGKNSIDGFRRFLCDHPLGRQRIPYPNPNTIQDHLPKYYGCYHQLHYIDGTLIAFSVLDILPGCISSVYFVWDPKYAWASLGKLSAIREAALAREMAEAGMRDMGWLYMGYYIHSCHKMRYKGEYKPSQLLDPGTNIFHPIETVVPILEAYPNGYHPFAQRHPESTVTDSSSITMPLADISVTSSMSQLTTSLKSAKKKRKIRRHTDWPDEPPPSFADPDAFDERAIRSLLVVLNGDITLPLSQVPFRNVKYAERTVRELAAAVGIDAFASTTSREKNVFVSF